MSAPHGVQKARDELAGAVAAVVAGNREARERQPDVVPGWFTPSGDALKARVPGALIKAVTGDHPFTIPFVAPVHNTADGLKIKTASKIQLNSKCWGRLGQCRRSRMPDSGTSRRSTAAAWRLQPEADPATPPAVFCRPCKLHAD